MTVTVIDEAGIPQAFVDVTLDGEAGNALAASELTDETGKARFVDIPPGRYGAGAFSEGLFSDRYEIELGSGPVQDMRILLKKFMAQEQTVDVDYRAAELVDVKEVNTATELRGEFINKIPIQNRRVGDVVAMMPGVVRTGASDSTQISVGGGTTAQAAYRLDGGGGDSPVDRGRTLQAPAAAIESFRLIASGASAEHGEQSTGIAEIVTGGHDRTDEVKVIGGVVGGVLGGALGGAAGEGDAAPPRAGEGYRRLTENAFRSPLDAPLSTFGIDVDTASYSIARSWLDGGALPPSEAVRIEEFVNAFRYDDPAPSGGDAFLATTEVASCPWAPAHRLVRIAIKGAEVDVRDMPPSNLVFLVDVSGSMSAADKLPLVKQSLRLLVERLRPEDSVGLVVYAGAAGVVLEPTGGADKAVIGQAIDRLQAGGSTAGAAGIQAAYGLAEKHFRTGGINRVVLATDGDFNVGVSSETELVKLIEEKRAKGVFLSVLGFGTGNYQDAKMEQLADHGNGNYAYVDSLDEARRVLVAEAAGTLLTIAKDVKIQVEVNPLAVSEYRLIGYENRVMPDEDFEDDAKDGGEIGAGHSVTALYEIVPATAATPANRKASKLRYQDDPAPVRASNGSGELMTVKVRWKLPDGETSDVIEAPVLDDGATAPTDDMRWSTAAAAFAMMLQGSKHAGGMTWPELETLAASAIARDDDGRRAGMLALVRKAASLQPRQVGEMAR